jgi:hypothetical protein
MEQDAAQRARKPREFVKTREAIVKIRRPFPKAFENTGENVTLRCQFGNFPSRRLRRLEQTYP